MILFILILFSGINLLNSNETPGIDISQQLKSKDISCDLHDFVRTNNNSDDGYQLLKQDLANYCFSPTAYSSICNILFIKFRSLCLLPNNSRPLPIKYITDSQSKPVCSMRRVALTSNWIWTKLSSDEKQQIGSSPDDLCPKMIAINETLRLVKFFYKLTLRIAQLDTINKTDPIAETSTIKIATTSKETGTTVIQQEAQKTSTVLTQTSETTPNKINGTTNLQNNTVTTISPKEKTVEAEKNETKKTEEGSPFGRDGDDPERLQINERPKLKVLDVESVFNPKINEEGQWVKGAHIEKVADNQGPIKFEENPAPKSQFVRKRNPFKLKLNRYPDGEKLDDEHTQNSFITTVLIFILCIVLIYLIIHNKNKILGLIIEGCKRRRGFTYRRTPSGRRARLSQSTNQF